MLNAIYLCSIIVGCAAQNVFKKNYTVKTSGGIYWFSALSSLVALLFFAVSGGIAVQAEVLPYSLGFGIAYAAATVFAVLSLATGPLALTALINSFSLLLPMLYGLIFLQEDIRYGFVPGILLLALSLFLVNRKNESAPITPRWVVYVILSFLGNGLCSVVQKMQQVRFEGAYKNEFMFAALAVCVAVFLTLALVKERKTWKTSFRYGWFWAPANGFANATVNLFVMLLSGKMSASVMFPLISAGGIVLSAVLAVFLYKEKISRPQLVGVLCGIAAVVLLNL